MAEKICPLMRAPAMPSAFSHVQPQEVSAPAPCIEHRCRWYIHLIGTNPQTGGSEDRWGCAVEFLPVLLIENAKETRQAAGAIESARNEQARGVAALANALTTRDVGGRVLELKQ